jgi:hypothetical protein
MRIGASLLLIAVGAILKFAVTAQPNGINLPTVGVVLMIVGVLGLVITALMLSTRRRTDVRYHRDGVTYTEPGAPLDPLA